LTTGDAGIWSAVTRHRFLFQTTSRNSNGSSQRPALVQKESSDESEHSKALASGSRRTLNIKL